MHRTSVPVPDSYPGYEHITRIWDRTHDIWMAKILPGEFCIGNGEEAITTVLGSCVSACIRDTHARVGGMNHFMLPVGVSEGRGDDERYGVFAMERLVNEVLKHGTGRRDFLEVKLVGGGRVLASMTDIGRRNIEFARHFVAMDGLRVIAEDLGGLQPRKVVYFPDSGRLRVRKMPQTHHQTIEHEQRYESSLVAPPAGDVELF